MIYRTGLLAAVLLFTSCLDTTINSPAESSDDAVMTPRKLLIEMGYAESDIIETDTTFEVEGCMAYSKKSLDEFLAAVPAMGKTTGTRLRDRRGFLRRYWYYYSLSGNREQDLSYRLMIDDRVIQKGCGGSGKPG